MNKLQEVAFMISGYCNDDDRLSEKDEFYYYECGTLEEKKTQIRDMAASENMELTKKEIDHVYEYLEKSRTLNSSNDQWHLFDNLGK